CRPDGVLLKPALFGGCGWCCDFRLVHRNSTKAIYGESWKHLQHGIVAPAWHVRTRPAFTARMLPVLVLIRLIEVRAQIGIAADSFPTWHVLRWSSRSDTSS